MDYAKLFRASLGLALFTVGCTSHLGFPAGAADGGVDDSPDGGVVLLLDGGAASTPDGGVVVIEPDGGIVVSTPGASTFVISFGTGVYPGNSFYWDGLCGQFTFQQFSYDLSASPDGSGVTIGAAFSGTMNPSDAGANQLSIPCDPSIVDTRGTHLCFYDCTLDVGVMMEWTTVDCTTGATIPSPNPQESFVPAQCVANQATPVDAVLYGQPLEGDFTIIASTSVPPGNGDYPNGICATYSTQTFELDANSQATTLPPTDSASYTDSMNDALLTAAGMSPGEGTVWCADVLPSPILDTTVTVTASDFIDCATGLPIDALAGQQLSLSQTVDCVEDLIGAPTPLTFQFELGYPAAAGSSSCDGRALSYSFDLEDNYGIPPGDLCADFQVQPVQIAADGTRTPMGPPFLNSSYMSRLPPVVGCIASLAAPAPDWSEEVSALRLYDCTSGATVGGMGSPAIQLNDFNCAAESNDDLNLGIVIVPSQP